MNAIKLATGKVPKHLKSILRVVLEQQEGSTSRNSSSQMLISADLKAIGKVAARSKDDVQKVILEYNKVYETLQELLNAVHASDSSSGSGSCGGVSKAELEKAKRMWKELTKEIKTKEAETDQLRCKREQQ